MHQGRAVVARMDISLVPRHLPRTGAVRDFAGLAAKRLRDDETSILTLQAGLL